MKKLATTLCAVCAVSALLISIRASAETINYTITGWQVTCANSKFTGVQGDCIFQGSPWGYLSRGTITGAAQFIGDATNGGILTITTQSTYVTSPTAGVGPATITVTGGWFGIDGTGLVTDGGGGADYRGDAYGYLAGGDQSCTPTDDTICKTPNTPLGTTNINLYGPGTTIGGTLSYLVTALASGGANKAWQNYTLTVDSVVPEPGTALLWGAAMVGLALSGWIRKK